MRTAGPLALLAVLAALLAPGPAAAYEWHSQQPAAGALGIPTTLGPVGDVAFWAPNRGMLITAGNGGNPAGLFAYDGRSWYRYSTVCGGHDGRIAWAGPSEFWTISDQQAGQGTGKAPAQHISLCHFRGGQVVASYAEPLGLASSYLPMNAAACSGPNDCWFAGDRLPGTNNVGAFHLHWDGSSLTAVPSLSQPEPEIADPGRTVTSLAYQGGDLYEGVAVREGDVAPEESVTQPSFIHRITPGAVSPFVPLGTVEPISYGSARAEPSDLQGFRLSADPFGLWAIAGAVASPARITVLRLGAEGFAQIPLSDPEGAFEAGDRVGGAAAEVGLEDAWVGYSRAEEEPPAPARLTRVHADGSVDPPVLLPALGEGIGRKGEAGPIACPEAEQCWMATGEGWLFHLGPDLPRNTDPALHTLVEFRPPDDSLPSLPPISLPDDNSGADEAEDEEAGPEGEFPPERVVRALVADVHQKLIGHVLELSFVLRARARVQLLARRHGRVVAKTRRYTLGKGRHSLRLRLDPDRWPTKMDLQVHRAKGKR